MDISAKYSSGHRSINGISCGEGISITIIGIHLLRVSIGPVTEVEPFGSTNGNFQIFVLLKSRKLSQSETLREKPECVFVYLRLGHFLQLLELVEIERFGPA